MAKPSCYNRPAYKDTVVVPVGYYENVSGDQGQYKHRTPIWTETIDPMSKNCQQWGPMGEAKIKNWDCQGCRWKPQSQEESAPHPQV